MQDHFLFFEDDHHSSGSEHHDQFGHDLMDSGFLSGHHSPHDFFAADYDPTQDHPHFSDTLMSSAQVFEDDAGLHTVIDATPCAVLHELLQGHELTLLAQPHDPQDFLSCAFDDLAARTGGHAIFMRDVDNSNPDYPLMILADRSLPEVCVYVPMQAFLDAGDSHTFCFMATDKPWQGSGEVLDFDTEQSCFSTAYDWLIGQAPRVASGVMSYLIGDEVAGLLDNEAAGFIAHFSTERAIENLIDLDHSADKPR